VGFLEDQTHILHLPERQEPIESDPELGETLVSDSGLGHLVQRHDGCTHHPVHGRLCGRRDPGNGDRRGPLHETGHPSGDEVGQEDGRERPAKRFGAAPCQPVGPGLPERQELRHLCLLPPRTKPGSPPVLGRRLDPATGRPVHVTRRHPGVRRVPELEAERRDLRQGAGEVPGLQVGQGKPHLAVDATGIAAEHALVQEHRKLRTPGVPGRPGHRLGDDGLEEVEGKALALRHGLGVAPGPVQHRRQVAPEPGIAGVRFPEPAKGRNRALGIALSGTQDGGVPLGSNPVLGLDACGAHVLGRQGGGGDAQEDRDQGEEPRPEPSNLHSGPLVHGGIGPLRPPAGDPRRPGRPERIPGTA
jgi:hypothetical protein